MLTNISRTSLIGGWFATVAVTLAVSIVSDARVSTSALLLAIGLAPVVIMVIIAKSQPSPTIAEILHTVDATDSRG